MPASLDNYLYLVLLDYNNAVIWATTLYSKSASNAMLRAEQKLQQDRRKAELAEQRLSVPPVDRCDWRVMRISVDLDADPAYAGRELQGV
jgi:hypothetical protein